jgi:hypothetical protein
MGFFVCSPYESHLTVKKERVDKDQREQGFCKEMREGGKDVVDFFSHFKALHLAPFYFQMVWGKRQGILGTGQKKQPKDGSLQKGIWDWHRILMKKDSWDYRLKNSARRFQKDTGNGLISAPILILLGKSLSTK